MRALLLPHSPVIGVATIVIVLTFLYVDRRLGYLFIANFEEFLKKNPAALWQAQALQRKFMQFNIGIAYWEKKMEQFRVIREELGVKLL